MSMSIKASPDGTYGEILVNGAVVAKLPVTGNAVIPGLVGTVSQSGGVPTGAIIERGSNVNGNYIRYADGTQICRHALVSSGSDEAFWTYPAVFSNNPTISSTAISVSVTSVAVRILSPTNSSVGFSVLMSNNARAESFAGFIAIGRWY